MRINLKPCIWSGIILLSFVIPVSGNAQSLSQNVIGNAGNYQVSVNGTNLHWTVGEIAVEHFENTYQLFQGFHQMYSNYLIDDIWEADSSFELSLFPNPTSGWLKIVSDPGINFTITLCDIIGKELFKSEVEQSTELDISQLPDGLYLLSAFSGNELVKTFKINKH